VSAISSLDGPCATRAATSRSLLVRVSIPAAGSLVWLTRIGLHSGYASAVLGPLMVAGLGIGFTIAPSNNTGTFGVDPRDAGVASATLNTGQQVGGSVGTSLLNTIFASAVAHYLTSHLSPATLVHGRPAPALTAMSLIHGYTTGFWVAAAIFGVGAVICGTLFRSGPLRAPASAAATPPGTAIADKVTALTTTVPLTTERPCLTAPAGTRASPSLTPRLRRGLARLDTWGLAADVSGCGRFPKRPWTRAGRRAVAAWWAE
jgi:hypothetical protein